MIKEWKIALLCLAVAACGQEQNEENKPEIVEQDHSGPGEHRLKNFYINAEPVSAHGGAGINDLRVDYNENDNLALVAFDCEVPVGCEWKGEIEPGKDTVYLYYYQHCEEEDDIVTESREMRFHYEITNGLGLRKKVLVPKLMEGELE